MKIKLTLLLREDEVTINTLRECYEAIVPYVAFEGEYFVESYSIEPYTNYTCRYLRQDPEYTFSLIKVNKLCTL